MTALSHPNENVSEDLPARPQWMTQAWLEPRLVVLTLAAIVLSLISEKLDAPHTLITILNVSSYITGGVFGVVASLEALRHRHINVDLLMVLAAVGAALVDQWHEGAILLFLFSLSNVLQAYAIGRSRQAIRGLLKLYPSEAKVRRDGQIEVMKIDRINIGDVVLIEPGERIPVDGLIINGRSAVDQSPITGKSMPVEKGVGDKVFAGTLNQTDNDWWPMLKRVMRKLEVDQGWQSESLGD